MDNKMKENLLKTLLLRIFVLNRYSLQLKSILSVSSEAVVCTTCNYIFVK